MFKFKRYKDGIRTVSFGGVNIGKIQRTSGNGGNQYHAIIPGRPVKTHNRVAAAIDLGQHWVNENGCFCEVPQDPDHSKDAYVCISCKLSKEIGDLVSDKVEKALREENSHVGC